ncbi:Inorganic pyrophosphatase [Candidatus Hepatincola sp. Pdp]
MDISKIAIGNKAPDEFNAIIEIPSGINPVKYEVDKDSGMLIVDRFLTSAMYYPCNYGFVPHTLAKDGDPIDVLVFTHMNVMPGSVIKVRPIGALHMEDEAGFDVKVLAVPISKITTFYDKIKTYEDLPDLLLNQIKHFFAKYKDLDEGKWTKVGDMLDIPTTKKLIVDSIEAYKVK